jgi:putative ABC transport system permease protein
MRQSLRLAFRQFTQHRAFALVTVLILGLGVGASAAVYSIVDGVLLEPLPYAEPDRLITWWDTNVEQNLRREPLSPVNFMDFRDLEVFDDAAAWWRPVVNLTDPGLDPLRVSTIETGANLFGVLGVHPQLGPGFAADGPMFSPDLQAVISSRLWRTRYDADPDIIGKVLQFNATPYTVVGVMPDGFQFPDDVDVWQRSRWDFTQHSRNAHFMEAVARLAPDVMFEEADAAMTGLAQRLENDFPQTNAGWGVRPLVLLHDQLGYYRPALFVLFGAVGLLMVIACLNVASLLLTRALSREREMAVRTALGASPRHLVVQLMAEAALNARVLGFALAIAVATTLIFGLMPALVVVRRSLSADLKAGERGSSRASRFVYRAFVTGEVALAAALLVSSGLLVRTVMHMMDVPTGVGAPEVVTASVQLSGPAFSDSSQATGWIAAATMYGQMLDRLREQPGIDVAGAANFLPLEPGWRVPFVIEGEPPPPPDDAPFVQYQTVMDGFFESIGATLVSGRFFTSRDDANRPGAIVVNEAFARRFLADRDPLRTVLLSQAARIGPLGASIMPDNRFEIVGVVADVRNVPLGQPTEPTMYFSGRQYPYLAMFLTARGRDLPTVVSSMRAAVAEVAPGIPLTDVSTWADRFRARAAEPRLLMTLLVFFGALAGLLAALGVYGLFAWMVALKQRELAIRITLGARPSGIGMLVLRQGAMLIGLGLVVGLAIVQLASGPLTTVLFEATPRDVGPTVVAAAILLVATLIACLPPAWRAMRVDPIEGLRVE